jgi:hypothetical protein
VQSMALQTGTRATSLSSQKMGVILFRNKYFKKT